MILNAGMAHPRKLIRHAVVALLRDAGTTAGQRVVPSRVEPHKKGQLPALSVYTLSDDVVDSADPAPVELTRDIKLEVAGWVGHSDDYPVDDRMDDLAEQVEAAMDGDPYLGGTAAESILKDTQMQVLEENGSSDPLIGIVVLTYQVTYRTSPALDDELDDFLTVDAKHKVAGGVNDTVPAEDNFVVQETP